MVSRIRVCRALWSETTESGGRFDPAITPQHIDSANKHFQQLFQRCSSGLNAGNFYDFDTSLFKGNDDHKWGKAPFHYVDSYYRALVAQIERDRSGLWPQSMPPLAFKAPR